MTIKEFLDRFNREGSHKISGEIYALCRNPCMNWLFKQGLVKETQDAKDIFSDALLVLLDNAERGRIEPSATQVQTYLTTICRNLESNRRKRKDRASEYAFDDALAQIQEENREGAIEKERALTHLEKILAGLKEPCATLFRLYYYEGYSHKAIAVAQGYNSEGV